MSDSPEIEGVLGVVEFSIPQEMVPLTRNGRKVGVCQIDPIEGSFRGFIDTTKEEGREFYDFLTVNSQYGLSIGVDAVPAVQVESEDENA